MTNLGRKHWNTIKRILRYIKGTSDTALCYGGSESTVRGYVDSNLLVTLRKENPLQAICSQLQEEL
jgi:hypothetical protein